MYFLHVRFSDILGRDDYIDRTAWQRDALRSLDDGATFVLMHEGDTPLRVAELAPLAASQLPTDIYLSESARLVIDVTELGPTYFVPSAVLQPLYQLRYAQLSTHVSPAVVEAVSSDTLATLSKDHAAPVGAKRGRGRPRKQGPEDQPAAQITIPALDLMAVYPSSSEFFAEVLNEENDPGLSALKAYLGFRKKKESVAELARAAKITRAGMDLRIKSYGKAYRQKREVAAMVSVIKQLMAEAAGPVLLSAIPEIGTWFKLEDVQEPGFADYLNEISDGEIDCLPTGNGLVLSPVPKTLWNKAGTALRAWLLDVEAHEAPVSIQDFDAIVCKLLPEGLPDTFADLLVDSIDNGRVRRARFPDGDEVIAGFGAGIRPMLRVILLESESPIHQSEILERLRVRFQLTQTDTAISSAVVVNALPFGPSTYGLRHHIGLSEEELLDIITAAEEVASNDPERQWKTREIAQVILESEKFAVRDINPRRLNVVLKAGPTVLHDLGRGIWSFEGAMPRQQIHDIVVEALTLTGRTMSNEELRLAIEKSRGIDETFQIQPRDPLFRVARGTWGLLDRDLPVLNDEVDRCLGALRSHLILTGEEIHVSEVCAVIANTGIDVGWITDPEVLLALARRKGSMRVTYARYLALLEWEGERRVMPTNAVLRTVQDNPVRKAPEIAIIASALAGREISTNLARSLLNDGGYFFNNGTGMWTRQPAAEELDSCE